MTLPRVAGVPAKGYSNIVSTMQYPAKPVMGASCA